MVEEVEEKEVEVEEEVGRDGRAWSAVNAGDFSRDSDAVQEL